MKENEIKFKLQNNDGKIIELTGEIKDNKIYRMGKPVLCNCTGNTQDTATPFIYEDGKIICPECKKQSVEIYTFEDYEKNEKENLHLIYFGTDYITMQELYKISYTLPYEEWSKVSDLFMKLQPDMVDMGFFEPKFVGWVTSNPEEVENRLNIKPELRVEYLKKQKQAEEENKNEVMEKLNDTVMKILEVFTIVDTAPMTDKGKFKLQGEVINNPLNPRNDYGGGEWFVITDDEIWYVRNNSRDGDNWNFNNVYVKGTAGAIGKKIAYDEEVAELIRELKR